jgi:hypothetical protein
LGDVVFDAPPDRTFSCPAFFVLLPGNSLLTAHVVFSTGVFHVSMASGKIFVLANKCNTLLKVCRYSCFVRTGGQPKETRK